jgi:hypothetical protein
MRVGCKVKGVEIEFYSFYIFLFFTAPGFGFRIMVEKCKRILYGQVRRVSEFNRRFRETFSVS